MRTCSNTNFRYEIFESMFDRQQPNIYFGYSVINFKINITDEEHIFYLGLHYSSSRNAPRG